jgi:hypothetical protein
MFSWIKFRSAFAVAIVVAAGLTADGAFAITAEVAKKCQMLMAHAYPPRVPGNPAAGSDKGSGADQQKYYQNCIANNGDVGGDSSNAPDK